MYDQGLQSLCQQVYLRDKDLVRIYKLVEHGAPFSIFRPPTNKRFKANLRLILFLDEDCKSVDLALSSPKLTLSTVLKIPKIAQIIIQESEEELTMALNSGLSSPNENWGTAP